MAKYRKKPVVIEAIAFDELVEHGRQQQTQGPFGGMPWSFQYAGHPITHENDDCYLIPTLEGTMKMGRDDMLITDVKGEIYPCKRDIFDATYEPVDLPAPGSAPSPPIAHVLQFFAYAHLPERLQAISKPFAELANQVVGQSSNQETTIALRKLLEAKDAAVRAVLAK